MVGQKRPIVLPRCAALAHQPRRAAASWPPSPPGSNAPMNEISIGQRHASVVYSDLRPGSDA